MRSRWREISSTVVSINSAASPLSPRTKRDRKSTRLNSSHSQISYAVFCLKKKNKDLSHNAPYDPHAEPSEHHDDSLLTYSCYSFVTTHPAVVPRRRCTLRRRDRMMD